MVNTKNSWLHNLFAGLKTVFKRRSAWIITSSGFVIVLLAAALIASWGVVQFAFGSPFLTFGGRMSAVWSVITLYFEATPFFSLVLTSLVALLTGMNVAVVVYYVKQRVAVQQAAGVSMFGLIISLFGVGCTACGSVLLTALFGFGATTQVLGVLPLHGLEFSLLSVILLASVTGYLAIKANTPLVCEPSKEKPSNN